MSPIGGGLQAVLRRIEAAARAAGRDPGEIAVSTQGLLFLSTDESWLKGIRESDIGRAAIVGNPAEVAETVGRYRDAGADELIIPAFTMSTLERAKDTCDLFINEVAANFR